MPEVLKELRAAARQPVRDDELRRAVIRGVAAHAASIMRTLRLRTILAAAGVLVLLTLASAAGGVAAGWWFFRTATLRCWNGPGRRCTVPDDGDRGVGSKGSWPWPKHDAKAAQQAAAELRLAAERRRGQGRWARSTVAEALKVLEWAGVLTWQHRITRVRERCTDLLATTAGSGACIVAAMRTCSRTRSNKPQGHQPMSPKTSREPGIK